MAKRHPKPARKNSVAADPEMGQSAVERLIASGKVKEAFKEAKLDYHKQPSAENRHLVERTYLLRIRALIQGGMTSAGQEVATSALEFGVKDPGLMGELILLLPQVGLAERAVALQAQFGSPEGRAQLMVKLADSAVLHPERAGGSPPEVSTAAEPVRAAFAALDAGNDGRALELLQPIPRNSPMADWRYFVRGLVAFRHHDRDQAKANWERLDPHRAAQKIARALLADQETDGTPELRKAKETHAFGEPVLGPLADLRAALDANDWNRVLNVIKPLRPVLNRIDRRLAQRLTDIVLLPLSAELKKQSLRGAQRLLADFKAALEPLPWDPKWHRFEALVWQGPQGDPHEAIGFWRRYLRDLEQGVTGLPGEPRQVQALVWRRIGEITSDLAGEDEPEGFPFRMRPPGPPTDELRARAVEALQQSVRLDPKQRETHQLLIDNYFSWDQPEHVVGALEELLKAFPDDVDALRQLIHERELRDEPEHVLSAVERLRKLKPLDTRLDRDEAWGRLALARHLALKSRWDDARAEFARVETALSASVVPYRVLARRAALEFRAGNAPQAEEYISRARSLLKEPTALWLALAIEMTRYEAPPALTQQFQGYFRTGLARKVTSETAGELADVIEGYFSGLVDYPGRADHLEEIVRYLRRTTRTKYREPDLRHVCALLRDLEEEDKLLSSLLNRGLKLFPQSPYFPYLSAEQDVRDGPMSVNFRYAREKLERALALARASQNPEDAELASRIQELLARVSQFSDMMAALPFGGAGGGPFGGAGGGPFSSPGSFAAFREMFESLAGQFGDPDSDFEDDDEPEDGPKKPPKRKTR